MPPALLNPSLAFCEYGTSGSVRMISRLGMIRRLLRSMAAYPMGSCGYVNFV